MNDRFLTLSKLERRIGELERFRYMDMFELEPMEAMEDATGRDEVHRELPQRIEGFLLKNGDMFCNKDGYLWIRKRVSVPEHREGCVPVGVFDFSRGRGFEAQLYVDGHPYQGIDSNHKEVVFFDLEGKEVEFTFLLWSGIDGGGSHHVQEHQIHYARVGYLHQATDDFYYYTRTMLKTIHLLEENRTERYELLSVLNHAFLEIDWGCFYDTVGNGLRYLEEKLKGIKNYNKAVVNLVGHTHIDVAWLWRLKHTREKAMRSFSTVLHLMEEFEDYIFLQSQPQLYDFIKEDSPELYEKIKRKVAENKWECDGGMWLEADCNITSGESLSRQFLYGIRFLQKEFHKTCTYLWLPDVFGYSWALPQIMKQCGIHTFATTKISWNQYNTIPDDLFWWKGIDGSKVMAYFVTTPDDGRAFTERFTTYNGMMTPHTVLGTWEKFKNKELSEEVLLAYGFGDGGGGVTRDMLKSYHAITKMPGIPKAVTRKAGEFFSSIHKKLECTKEYVHTWDGELYLEYHRGTYTSQAKNKKWNRYMENLLAQTEWLSSLSLVDGGNYEKDGLLKAWKVILRNQFHDIIPGSSIHEVYEDSIKEYEKAEEVVTGILKRAETLLFEMKLGHYVLYSFSSFARRESIFLPVKENGYFKDVEGNVLKSQKAESGYYVLVSVPPIGFAEVVFCRKAKEEQEDVVFHTELSERRVETPYYKINWDENGNLTRIYDKENKREVLAEGGRGNVLECFEDKPLNYDAWDIDIFYQEKKEEAKLSKEAYVLEEGSLQLVIRFEWSYRSSTIIQDMVLYSEKRRIDFETKVCWREEHKLLKVAFETSVRSTKASFDIQYGFAERPTHYNTSWDMARFEVVGHKWADLSETNYGVSLLNQCKYGYSVKENVMKLSLLKSSKSPDAEADMGIHQFIYSLLPHVDGVTKGGTIEEAAALNLPVGVWKDGSIGIKGSIIRTDSDSIWIDAVKKAEEEDCIVVRMHECKGGTVSVQITSDYKICGWKECNILEEDTRERIDGKEVNTVFRPFEIKNFKLYIH